MSSNFPWPQIVLILCGIALLVVVVVAGVLVWALCAMAAQLDDQPPTPANRSKDVGGQEGVR